jgi:hypothetical protein
MTHARGTAQHLAARLGFFAVLFQAILFGWHHHDLIVAGRLAMPVMERPAATPQVIDDEDGCEICQVLHHLTAAPVDAVSTAPPLTLAVATAAPETVFAVRGLPAGFHARAPPLA